MNVEEKGKWTDLRDHMKQCINRKGNRRSGAVGKDREKAEKWNRKGEKRF